MTIENTTVHAPIASDVVIAMNGGGAGRSCEGSKGHAQVREHAREPLFYGRDSAPDTIAVLHALLQAAGEKPPYVLVGASRGGLYVRQYVDRYPDDVVGMVLIDPTHEDRLFTTLDGKTVTIASLSAEQLRSTFAPGPPVTIPRRAPQTGPAAVTQAIADVIHAWRSKARLPQRN